MLVTRQDDAAGLQQRGSLGRCQGEIARLHLGDGSLRAQAPQREFRRAPRNEHELRPARHAFDQILQRVDGARHMQDAHVVQHEHERPALVR